MTARIQTILKKNKAWGAALPGLKSHCKSTKIKIVCGIGLRMIKDLVIIIPGMYSHISILICIFRIKKHSICKCIIYFWIIYVICIIFVIRQPSITLWLDPIKNYFKIWNLQILGSKTNYWVLSNETHELHTNILTCKFQNNATLF